MQAYLKEAEAIIKNALIEDIGRGDITSQLVITIDAEAEYVFAAREDICLCGLDVAKKTFALVDGRVKFKSNAKDGDKIKKGKVITTVSGSVRSILKGERVALNFMQHLSAISTKTSKFVLQVKGTGAKILDTRKTTPGLRGLEKYAVFCGGGKNHRMRLDDGILIKDNHIDMAGGIKNALEKAKKGNKHKLLIEVECDNLKQVSEALSAGADIIMLDNMDVKTMKKAVRIVAGKALLEASGGVNIKNVKAIAKTGVDFISVGALTHSAASVDIGLDIVK